MSTIVQETVGIIWQLLSPIYVKEPTAESCSQTATMYYQRCNFPNVIGAIDGKHVRIRAPPNSGSNFYNYKQFFSIILQGIADPTLRFISVEVGAYGKESDGGVFSRSEIKRHLESNSFHIPALSRIPNSEDELPFFLIGDAAYPLKPYLITPINAGLDHDRRIFNYRHSRARRCIECAFGILASKWRVLKSPIETKVDTAVKIVLATVALHNAIIHHEGANIQEREIEMWDDSNYRTGQRQNEAFQGRPGHYASWVRDRLVHYFVNNGAVSWQEQYI